MEITVEMVRSAYAHTHVSRNGVDIDKVFENGTQSSGGYWSDVYNLVYYLLESMSNDYNFPFHVNCLFSDGGVKDFLILYKWSDYDIIISREYFMGKNNMNFKSIQELCDWLNNHIKLIEFNTIKGGALKH